MEIVNSISQSINSSLNSAFILDTALYQFKDLFRADLVGYFEVDPETDQVIGAKYCPISPKTPFSVPTSCKVLTGLFRKRSPVVIANAGQDERIRYWISRYPDFASGTLMLAPLVNNQKVVGVMLVARLRLGPYTPDDLQVLQVLSSVLATAVENAHLYQNLGGLLTSASSLKGA